MELAPLARVTRSGFVESVHHGSAVVLGADGAVRFAAGVPERVVLPRSALKPLQALALLRAGLGLDGELLALACASHSGESFHLDGVRRILADAGLTTNDLRNTPDVPLGEAERRRWQAEGRIPNRTVQNCSGNHAAMLATCRLQDWPIDGHLDAGHPLQRAVRACVEDLAEEPVAATAVDGCGAPAFAISLTGLARAFGRLVQAPAGTAEGRVAEAIRRHPQWLGGTGREVTELIRAVPGLIAKDGAEAVYAAALPDGTAIALKIADGSDRPRQAVMVALLERAGVSSPVLDELARRPVLGHGRPVGFVTAVFP